MSDNIYILEFSMENDLDFYVRRTICGVYSTLEKAMEAGRLLIESLRDDPEGLYCDDIIAAYIYNKKLDITDPYAVPIYSYKWSSVNERWMEA